MAGTNWIKLEFPADTRNVAFARTSVAVFAAQLDWTLDELEDIKVAVSEAVSNSVIHGYSLKEGTIQVSASSAGEVLEIIVEDFGRGIKDIEKAQETGYSSLPEERMGLGFTFMFEYMDKVLVSSTPNEGTKVKMIKKVKRRES
ncbi:MAG TPA: anti-sigma F factor [Firmicutes bacterium]|nr:anti-sigma F factor [Bacillota bacterium]